MTQQKKTNEEQMETEQLTNVETILTNIVAEPKKDNSEQIMRIRFKTSFGEITWKPKTKKSEFIKGIEYVNEIPYERGALPEKLNEWGTKLQEKSHIKIKLDCTEGKVDKGAGIIKKFYFITSEKTFNEKWSIIEAEPSEEKVD